MVQIAQRSEFGFLLNALGLDGCGAELGVLKGDFSQQLLMTSFLKKLYLIDTWKEYKNEDYFDRENVSQKEQDERFVNVKKRMEGFKERAEILRMDCDKASEKFKDNFFDFVYLDANHSKESVLNSLKKWFPKVKEGGIIAGHDYYSGQIDNTYFGVKDAVDEFITGKNIRLYTTRRADEMLSWYFFKGKEPILKKRISPIGSWLF